MVLEDLEDDLYAEAEEQDTMAEEEDSKGDNDVPHPVGGGAVPRSRGEKTWSPFVAINERKRYLNKLSDEEIFDMFYEYYLGYVTKGRCIR
eukprot:scaffold32401_cov53-Attheya_sp.AAC.1